MVCTLGKGRMAAMSRLLSNGNYPEMTAEEIGYVKLAAQSIHRELCDADEANLLEEEDMHVFDRKPMTDFLRLVCCNSCKKPVKASQYAAHAERCRSLNCSEEIVLELDGGTGHKKPPRKGRRKSQIAHENSAITVGDHENVGSMDRDDTAASESAVANQAGLKSFCREAKRNSASIGVAPVMGCSVLCPRSTNYTAVVMSPSEKRTKLVAAEHLLIPKDLETANGVTVKASTYSPVPLATKMYHSQRNMRLRFALNYLYHEESTKDHCSESSKLVHETVMLPSQVSLPKDLLHDPQSLELFQKKKDAYSSTSVQEPDQVLVKSSELCLENAREYTSAMDFTNQFRDNFSRSALSVDTASMGKMRTRYRSTAYSYTGNSGTSLGNIQKPSGSVHVV